MTGIDELLAVMRRLRDPEHGCPWDVEQTFATIAPFTIEEAYEVADAIAREDWDGLEGEVGDLLLQVGYYAQMADERGLFDFDRVARGIAAKMIARHPHVFGEDERRDVPGLHQVWEERKAAERLRRAEAGDGDTSALAEVPVAFPALTRALKLQTRAARVGFDWPGPEPVVAKLHEELAELAAERQRGDTAAVAAELGDLLFTAVNLARHLGVDPETALRETNQHFERRFRRVEALAAGRGQAVEGLGVEALDALWEEAKAEERTGGA